MSHQNGFPKYSQLLSIVPLFWHNANFEKVGIINRGDYRQRKIFMFYYEIGTTVKPKITHTVITHNL